MTAYSPEEITVESGKSPGVEPAKRFRLITIGTLVSLLILGLSLLWPQFALQYSSRWQKAAPGLEAIRLQGQGDMGIRVKFSAVRIDPERYALTVVDYQGVGSIASSVCPHSGAAINASFFAQGLIPIGLLVFEGKKRYPRYTAEGYYGGWGFLVVQDGKTSLMTELDSIPSGAEYVMQCGPPLVVDGAIPCFKRRGPARRAAVGMDAQRRVVFAVAEGGVTFEQWAAFLRDRLGCVDALNLDGGPSAQLAVKGRINISVSERSKVPIFLLAAPISPRD